MKNVLFIPGKVTENDYLVNMGDVFKILGYNPKHFSVLNFIKNSFNRNILFINWLENQTRNRGLAGLIVIFLFLIVAKLLVYKIVYVRHNKLSHNVVGKCNKYINKLAIDLIQFFSSVVICHGLNYSKENNLHYIPHPCYIEESDLMSVNDFSDLQLNDFPNDLAERILVFGRIQKYKNVDTLLQSINLNQKVIIAGTCDPDYKIYLDSIILSRSLDVIYFDRFISNEELNYLIISSKQVVVSTTSQSCIMSGAIIHALNLSASVIVLDDYFCKELHSDIKPFVLSHTSTDKNANNKTDLKLFFNHFSKSSVAKYLGDILFR